MKNILAFTGKSYSGKDKCCILVHDMDAKFHIVHFADLPKQEFAEKYNIPLEDLSTPGLKEQYRPALISYTEGKKVNDKAFWAKASFHENKNKESVVYADLRFLEECELIVKSKGVIYKVQANPEVRKARGWIPNPEIDRHPSECELDLSPHTFWTISKGGGLFNNTTEDKLRKEINFILNHHFAELSTV